ncbi:MAG: TIM barrel protein [Phycisphaerales bacterium]|nr:TIM barrel protein [Phycisphaerales bacterium]
MNRRTFLTSTGAIGAAATLGRAATIKSSNSISQSGQGAKFSMKFAPHFGMFRHHAGDDHIAQLEFAADVGFTAWEDNGMAGRSTEDQKKLASAMDRLGLEMGVFVLNMGTAWGPSFSRNNADDREKFLDEARKAVEVAKRVNAQWTTVVLGTREPRLDLSYQTSYAVDMLRRACDILEPSGLTMVLEPLNPRDHPNMLLAEMGHAYEICRAVDSPSCKILDDLYHQQITEGNLIPNIDRAWDEIAYFQIGDNPGRREPTTGEINYHNVFKHIKSKGFAGIMGMEHGLSVGGKEGEVKLIEAYRSCDPGT